MSILRRNIRDVTMIIVHCSASDKPEHDDIAVIKQWHLERGFIDVGYHYFIQKSGNIQKGRDLLEVGAHCQGVNFESVGICLAGEHDFTEEQMKAAAKLIDQLYVALPCLKTQFGVLPHRFLNRNKTCPNFELSRIFKYMTSPVVFDRKAKYL